MPKINPWRLFRIPKRDNSISDYYLCKDIPQLPLGNRNGHRQIDVRRKHKMAEMSND
jgi:hypothetical protein